MRQLARTKSNLVQQEQLGVRAAIFMGALAFFVFAIVTMPTAQASTQRWSILPGINEGDNSVSEYGWHYDESASVWYGARDLNHPDDGAGVLAWLRTRALTDLPWEFRYYRSAFFGGCGMTADAQVNLSGNWLTWSGTTLHYLHIYGVISGPTSPSGVMQFQNDTINAVAGMIAYSGFGPQCIFAAPHLHQSAFLQPGWTAMERQDVANETCWVESDIGQCPGSYTRAHNTSLPCTDPGQPLFGSFSKSGTIWAQYVCQVWSWNSFSESTPLFYALF